MILNRCLEMDSNTNSTNMKNQITKETFEKAEQELQDLLFPVEIGDVQVKLPDNRSINADHFKGIVRTDNDKIFSIVTNNYKLITNLEALNTGIDIFNQLFRGLNANEIRPFHLLYPSTYSYCHIQLIHEKVNFQVFEQDTWLPFLQISNSYNRTFALSYELGFVRRLCMNGVIFKKNTVEIKAVHNKSENLTWKLNVGIGELKKMEMEFIAYMKNLQRFYISPKHIVPLICKILNFEFELGDSLQKEIFNINRAKEMQIEKDRAELTELKSVIHRLSETYFNEMGHNAYAAFNIVTDLISNEHKSVSKFNKFALHSTSYYYKPTEWLFDFVHKIEKPDFDIQEYLKDYLKYAA